MNKVETRVEALFNVKESDSLSEGQRVKICQRLKNRINSEGILIVTCAETRSQKRNRTNCRRASIAFHLHCVSKKENPKEDQNF